MSKLVRLNSILPPEFLNATALLSFLSVVVLVFLFFYLNRYTGRRYFSLWTLGWVFYAVWLAMGPAPSVSTPFMVMMRHWCIGLSAALLFWGSVNFLELPSRPAVVCLFMGFLLAWSYVGAYHLKNPWHTDAPIFEVIGLASLVTAFSFYRLRKHREYLGAGLLTFGFVLWGIYLGACPFFTRDNQLAGTGFLVAAVLQLFIAVSMIVLVLEEARAANEMILEKVRAAKMELEELTGVAPQPEEKRYHGVFDRSKLSEKLKVAYVDLKEAQEKNLQRERLQALGQMSRGIAHDINNALTPIMGYSNLLLREFPGLPEDVRYYVSSIKTAGEKISQSVACIRDFYRQQGGKDVLRPVELNAVAREVMASSRVRWQESPLSKGVAIDFDSELDSAGPRLLGMKKELGEALEQLMLNAIEAMPKGGLVKLSTGVLASSAPEPNFTSTDRVFVEVVDTGVGMDERTRQRCLEPFFSTKEQHGARGLGLSKAFGIVQRHEGEIQIRSERGEGTTVRLVFPGVPAGNTERFFANPSGALPRLRILCIDDEPSVLDVLSMVLKSGGHQVETAGDGQTGLDAFRDARVRNEPFDVVVTDLGMPRVDGHQVARTIKQESFKTPVIMLTGWGGIMQAEGTHPLDVDMVLGKPPQVSELIGALQKVTAEQAA